MTITAASNPETVGLDPAALKRLVAAIQSDIDHRPLRHICNATWDDALGAPI